MSKALFVLTVALLSVAAFGQLYGELYDAFNDFSTLANPSTFWSFGRRPSASSAFVAFNTAISTQITGGVTENSNGNAGWNGNNGATNFPYVLKITNGPFNSVPTGALDLHPGCADGTSQLNYAVVRWTSPFTGNAEVYGQWYPGDSGSKVGRLLKAVGGGASTTQLNSWNPGNQQSFYYYPIAVTVGDTLEMAVDPNGSCNGDSTGLKLFVVGPLGRGLTATYYDNRDLTGLVYVQVDPEVNFNWGSGGPAGIYPDTFSVNWRGQVMAPADGQYQFYSTSDDGWRLKIDGNYLINQWNDHPPSTYYAPLLTMRGGERLPIEINFYENGGGAVSIMYWSGPFVNGGVVERYFLWPLEEFCCHQSLVHCQQSRQYCTDVDTLITNSLSLISPGDTMLYPILQAAQLVRAGCLRNANECDENLQYCTPASLA